MDFVKILKDADKKGKLEEVKKQQVINFKEIEKGIAGLETVEQMMNHYRDFEPLLYRFLLKHQGHIHEFDQYEQYCRTFEDNLTKYYLYVFGYFIPWLQKQREAGLLKYKAVDEPIGGK